MLELTKLEAQHISAHGGENKGGHEYMMIRMDP